MRTRITIKHKDWLRQPETWSSTPDKIRKMILDEKMPDAIAGWCLVVALKHDLRAVYGSDLRAAWALLVWALANKWEAHVTEPIANLFYQARYGFSWCIWKACSRIQVLRFGFSPGWGRHDSPEPLLCPCGWGGMRCWAVHAYHDAGDGEAEPTDECPRCGQEI